MGKCDMLLMLCAIYLQAIDRRERLRRLALETIDLSKDPYFMRNHLGQVSAIIIDCMCGHISKGDDIMLIVHTMDF